MRAIVGVLVAALVAGCAADERAVPLRFSGQGLEGNVRLTLEPDGAAVGQRGTAEPFSFVLDDDELDDIAASVDAADLASQPQELRGDEPDFSDERYVFEHGDTRVEAEYQHAPHEVRELGRMLTRIVQDNAPQAGDERLEHTLRFASFDEQGGLRLTLEPDGSAQAQLGPTDPFTFMLDDDRMRSIAAAVAAADLPDQPAQIHSDPDVTDQVLTELSYGDADVEARGPDTPDGIRQLREVLVRVVHDNDPER